ncbi:MAG: endonuclease III [Thermanaerothrix sp.]|nr:endonuclease III [Thermanaerothrix sp.]
MVKRIRRSDIPGEGKAERVLAVFDALEVAYGNESSVALTPSKEPLEGLILTVLSQNTNDRNRDKAYQELVRRFPAWDAVAAASVEEVAEAIRVAGLGNSKAARIREILGVIRDRFGGYTMEPMKSWSVQDIREFLLSLPGVGPKTVACVLVFDLGIPAFPVDTHVARLSVRLGFVPPGMEPSDVQVVLEGLLPPERYIGAHVNMISHGRAVCRARGPNCRACVVASLCPRVGIALGDPDRA